jgi:hypothetical protein
MNQSMFQSKVLSLLTSINKHLVAIRIALAPQTPVEEPMIGVNEETDKAIDSYYAKDTKATMKLYPRPVDKKQLLEAMRDFASSQKDIPPDFARVLDDEFWNLTEN